MEEIVKTFDTIVDDFGEFIQGRYMLTVEIKHLESDGTFNNMSIGNVPSAISPSITFVIDDNIREQLDDLIIKVVDGKYQLLTREGYEFKTIEEKETEEEKQIRLLEEQLAALKAAKGVRLL